MPMEQPPSKETRVPVNLRIKFRSETIEQFVERYAVDVSRGGIFIRTREPLAVGTQLKFDFQLQNTSPLMAGEGTVVWIREHDPNRAGVTPGMGVRFDKLTAASQPVLDKILADKGKREPSGPNANTVSGKSGVSTLPVRRPSSTFSAVEPLLGAGPAAPGASSAGPIGGALPGPAGNPFAASSPSGIGSSPLGRPTQPLSSLSSASPGAVGSPPPGAPKPPAGAPGAGALPTVESQSALNRLATGPNLSAFGPAGAPRTKSPVPLPKTGEGSGRVTGTSGTPAVPTPLEDSDRTQIADGLPEFANEQPTHVGSPALSDLAASRAASITATSKRVPTPPPQPKLSLDEVAAPAASAPAEAPPAPSRTTSPNGGLGSGAAMRTTSPDGTTGADAAAISPGRLSSSQPMVGPHPNPGSLASDLAQTVPASARISAVTSAVRTDTPHATARVEPPKKKRTGLVIVVGGLAGAVLAVGGWIALKPSSHEPEESAPAQVTNAAAPAPAPAAPAGVNSEPAGANPAVEAKVGEGKAGEPKAGEPAAAEPKPGEPKAAEAKPAEPAAAEAKPAEAKPETKPADTKVAVAESAAAAKAGKRPRPLLHKKGAPAGKADDATGDAADDSANVVRIISLPTGADVLIDGQAVGKTPFLSKDIDPASPHALTVRKDGFDNHEHMVSPGDWVKGKGAGQNLRVTVKLHKAAGTGGGEAKAGGQDKDDKADKPAPPSTEPAKTEAPPPAETP
jgi:uncharacterized protein (TIGR02266 family)